LYKADPNNNKKQQPKQLVRHNPSFIQTFDTDAEAKVANPAKGALSFSIASNRLFIYNGTQWRKSAATVVG
jgi:hypothetical protein